MIISEKNKILEATEEELFRYYLRSGWDDIYSFIDYKRLMIQHGVKIKDDSKRDNDKCKLRRDSSRA